MKFEKNQVKIQDLAPIIENISRKLHPDKVDQQIVQFFAAFDQSQVNKIQKLTQQLINLKAKNKRQLNKQAESCTERSELENLLLDAVEECKRDVLRRRAEIATSKFQHFRTDHLKDGGVSGQMLLDAVCTSKDDLILLFEAVFGHS